MKWLWVILGLAIICISVSSALAVNELPSLEGGGGAREGVRGGVRIIEDPLVKIETPTMDEVATTIYGVLEIQDATITRQESLHKTVSVHSWIIITLIIIVFLILLHNRTLSKRISKLEKKAGGLT